MRQSFFWRGEALDEQEAVRGDAQRRVMVEAPPTTALEMAKPQFLLELLVVALDAPTQLGQARQLLDGGRHGQRTQEVLGRFRFVARPLDEQPLLWRRCGASVIAMGTADTDGSEARGQRRIRTLAPGDGTVTTAGQLPRQFLDRQRPVLGIAPQSAGRAATARPRRRWQRRLARRPNPGRTRRADHVTEAE